MLIEAWLDKSPELPEDKREAQNNSQPNRGFQVSEKSFSEIFIDYFKLWHLTEYIESVADNAVCWESFISRREKNIYDDRTLPEHNNCD